MSLRPNDNGAHFYNCDFQVHTPRDKNWSGNRPNVENRDEYAKKFIKACRRKNLDAVAITDHHEMTFFPHIKKAAKEETDDEGVPIPEEEKIIVFPGMELTLHSPSCQAIIIFDANLAIDQFQRIYTKLSLDPAPTEELIAKDPDPISSKVVKDLNHLYEILNSLDYIKGKFIVLPNVSDGGGHSILRRSTREHYENMRCVGGYIDGSAEDLSDFRKRVLNGKNPEYGNKAIAAIQTSDNRQRDFKKLGEHTTWIKWAEPTAEAIRQAFLAKESRLSHTEPKVPSIWIKSINVTNSKFLGSFNINFNKQYNAIIGGRGTGKSSILEYLRWCLCDQTTFDSKSEIINKRERLIENTLRPFGGEVRVTIVQDDVEYIIKKNSQDQDLLLKMGGESFKEVTEEDIRNLFPIHAYSQKQLSEVGVKTEELKRFIERPISEPLRELRNKIDNIKDQIGDTYRQLLRKNKLKEDISHLELESDSLENRIKKLRSSLIGLDEEDKKVIGNRNKYDKEKNLINTIDSEFSNYKEKIDEAIELFKNYPDSIDIDKTEVVNEDFIDKVQDLREGRREEILAKLQELKGLTNLNEDDEWNGIISSWKQKDEKFQKAYQLAKKKASKNQDKLTNIQEVEDDIEILDEKLTNKKSKLKKFGSPSKKFKKLRKEWLKLHKKKVKLLNDEATRLNKLSEGAIKADVTSNINIDEIKDLLLEHLTGSRIRADQVDNIFDVGEGDRPLNTIESILIELKSLAELKLEEDDIEEMPETPILREKGMADDHIAKISNYLTPENWLEVATIEINFDPEFSYSINSEFEDYIKFSEASAGQQATALLVVLLNQRGIPLMIDQPEDDIDNKAILDLVENIWKSKKGRQLIFSSHNANLVVNGDSELVVCCDYQEAGKQTQGEIKLEGAIDNGKVKEEITSVMEGGRKAFRLRQQKYGF